MKRIALALLLSVVALPAIAADNLAVTPGAGATIRMRDTTGAGGPLSSYVILGDLTGVSILGTAGISNANVLTMQGIASGTPVLVSQSGTWTIQQGTPPWSVSPSGAPSVWGIQPTGVSTITTGVAILCAATTGAPTYSTGSSNPLSCDLAGNLRTSAGGGGGAVTVADGADVTQGAKADTVCATDTGTCSVEALLKRINQNLAGSIPAGTNAIGSVTVSNANNNGRATSANSSPVVPSPAPSTYHLATNTAGTNASAPKGSAATLLSCQLGQTTTSAGFFKIYNKATAPTVGTDTPVVTLIIPGPAAGGGGSNVVFGPGGLTLGTGFAVATTGGLLDSDSSNGPAGITANCQYE